jgi:hypothetical protein
MALPAAIGPTATPAPTTPSLAFFAVARGRGCGVPKLCSHRGIILICRRNRVLLPHMDDSEKLRG